MTDDPLVSVRKLVIHTEEVWHDFGTPLKQPLLLGGIGAVVTNPYAGRYVDQITPMMEALKPLGRALADRLVRALGDGEPAIEAYGKGALVGLAGELEHGALWHVPGGYGMRERLGQARAIVPSTTKVGSAGTALDVPLHHINAAYVRSHFSTVTLSVVDAPRPTEILFCLAMATGGRPHARVGGLAASEISVHDGQR